ncbi:MAG: ferrous iron transport protein B [Thermoplasmata archaeon]|nr:ferrous iron transport protein B [Thermoplasmata archaeon]
MKDNKITIALTGNPNVGKTTIFNAITGARQHVGNWPGVTVEKKVGTRKHKGMDLEIVDLPGTYSLTAYSIDEVIARDYIVEEKPDVVIHIVDATNLERNLYLTTQLMEHGARIVIALNMFDLSRDRGDQIDIDKLSNLLDIPIVPTVGSTGEGIEKLLDEAIEEVKKGPHHHHVVGYGKEVERYIGELATIIQKDERLSEKYPPRWMAIKLLENDEEVLKKVKGSKIESDIKDKLKTIDTDELEALMADKRYEAIGAILPQTCSTCVPKMSVSDMIDKVVTNKYLGIPIFLALMWGAFEITFTFATPFMEIIDMGIGWLAGAVSGMGSGWLPSLLGDGIIAGVGAVLIFLPNILILFWLISLLEDSGYLARAAFIMDKLMYNLGLHGKSFIPMLMGFGCNVPAIMATRSIEDRKDRMITILVNPFISCGARLPVYVLLAGAFFGRAAGSVIFSLYAFGILVAILSAMLFRKTLFKGKPSPFIMELPPYRLPTLKTSVIHMWERGQMYLKKAGTIILLGVVFIWLLASLPAGVEYGSEGSYAGVLGKVIAPIFAPLGFDWRIAVALIFGFVAKEIVIGGLGTLYGVGEDEGALSDTLADSESSGIYPANALGLMVFTLLYMPCIAAVGVIKKETGSWKWTLFALAYGTILAWVAAFIIYQVGSALGYGG